MCVCCLLVVNYRHNHSIKSLSGIHIFTVKYFALWNTYLKWTPPSKSLCRNHLNSTSSKQSIQISLWNGIWKEKMFPSEHESNQGLVREASSETTGAWPYKDHSDASWLIQEGEGKEHRASELGRRADVVDDLWGIIQGQVSGTEGFWGWGWPGPSPDQVHMLFFWNHCGEDSSIQDSYNCPQGYHFWCDDTSRLGGAGREMGIGL